MHGLKMPEVEVTQPVPNRTVERIQRKEQGKRIAHMLRQQPVTDMDGTVLAARDVVIAPAEVLELRNTKRGPYVSLRFQDGTIVTVSAACVQRLGVPVEMPEAAVDDADLPSTNGDLSEELVVTDDYEPTQDSEVRCQPLPPFDPNAERMAGPLTAETLGATE